MRWRINFYLDLFDKDTSFCLQKQTHNLCLSEIITQDIFSTRQSCADKQTTWYASPQRSEELHFRLLQNSQEFTLKLKVLYH